MTSRVSVTIRISIHALREESDVKALVEQGVEDDISIHALREESDVKALVEQGVEDDISIHALREESDTLKLSAAQFVQLYFNPRSPRGERRRYSRRY